MKIRVAYAELVSTGNYGHRRAEAEVEFEVNNGDVAGAFERARRIVRDEVEQQLCEASQPKEVQDPFADDDLPF